MSRVVKKSDAITSNTLKKGDIVMGNDIVNYGSTQATGFYNGYKIPDNGYVVYKSNVNGLSVYAPNNNTDLVNILKFLGSNTDDLNTALSWSLTQNSINIFDKNYQNHYTDNLILNLDVNQLNSYPKNGNKMSDILGHGNLFTLYNTIDYNTNGYLNLDGVNEYIQADGGDEDFNFQYNTVFSVEILVKVEENTGYGYLLANRATDGNGTQYSGWGLLQDPSVGLIGIVGGYPSNLSRWRTVTVSPTNFNNSIYNKWAHIVWINTGIANEQKIYVNGINVTNSAYDDGGTTPYTVNYISQHKLTIGMDNWGSGGSYLTGKFSNLKIYQSVLSETQIKQNFYQSKVITDGLEFFYDIGNLVSFENGNTTIKSLIGTYSGSLINDPTYVQNNFGYLVTNGTVSYITTNYQLQAASNTNTQTICTWVRGGAGFSAFGSDADTTGEHELDVFYTNNTTLRFGTTYYNGTAPTTDQSNSVTIQSNTWDYIVIVKKSQYTYDLYVNGVRVMNNVIKGSTSNSNLRLGSRNISILLEQRISSVYAYNRALTDIEIINNFRTQSLRFI